MAHSFSTAVGTIEVVVHEASRIVSLSRLGADGRPVASQMCDWDAGDLTQALTAMKVPLAEAREIAEDVQLAHPSLAFPPPQPVQPVQPLSGLRPATTFRKAGIGRRFAAVLLDAIIVFGPLVFGVALMTGTDLPHRATPGQPSPGAQMSGDVRLFILFLWICYYVLAEALTGTTVGKRIVGIRVVEEDGSELAFGAAVVRNVLRPIDALFGCLVGALFALSSPRGQRLGDRVAHTVVVHR